LFAIYADKVPLLIKCNYLAIEKIKHKATKNKNRVDNVQFIIDN